MNLAGKRILVTGAGGGIGAMLACALAKKGGVLLLADRQMEPLEKLRSEIAVSGGKVFVTTADLLSEEAPQQLAVGFDLSRELRNSEYTKNIPLVMITSVNDMIPFRVEPDRTWLPVDALIEKPVEPPLLLAVVNRILKG